MKGNSVIFALALGLLAMPVSEAVERAFSSETKYAGYEHLAALNSPINAPKLSATTPEMLDSMKQECINEIGERTNASDYKVLSTSFDVSKADIRYDIHVLADGQEKLAQCVPHQSANSSAYDIVFSSVGK